MTTRTPVGGNPGGTGEFRTGATAAAATPAVLDAIGTGQLSAGQPGDCGFWAAKAATRPAVDAARAQTDTGPDGWAGRGFTRPGPRAEVPAELYRAALEDALAYTTDHDGCGDCDRDRLCETHAARVARAEQYRQAIEQEWEAGS